MKEHIKGWNENYQKGRSNRYPFDQVVSFVMSNYASKELSAVRILDMGCGGGNHVKFLADEGFDYYGTDGSEVSIKLTRNLVGIDSANKLTVADFTKLPYSNSFFDGLIDRQSMGHNSRADIVRIIAEIHRILKEGGKYHGHVFGLNDGGFAFGENKGSNDYVNFREGHFKKAHLVHGFDYSEIAELFSAFSDVSVQRQVTYDGSSDAVIMEIYIINATK
jgi:SAM-dependent methyltransferase